MTDYHLEVHDGPLQIDAKQWNALLATQSAPSPFMRHEYLCALHTSGSAVPEAGWTPQFITLWSAGQLVAACATYLKAHSYGEYVFDWAWAEAYQRHGLHYYPKLLAAVPFTPVPGSRMLALDDGARQQLVLVIRELAIARKLSSAHVLFIDDNDRRVFEAQGWMMRSGVQFHWTQSRDEPVRDFTSLLAQLQRDKRKKIQQERRKVAAAGVHFTRHEGAEIDGGLWDFFYRCYALTYRAHHSTPYLTRDFFTRMAQTMAQHWLMFVAHLDGEPVAASLIAIDRQQGAAWGRYWGATVHVPCLHFEACYYQPLQWCIEAGFSRFEGGAQGEHKMARGLLPVPTWSAHWLRDERFGAAVADFLASETEGIAHYVSELDERNPFKAAPPNEPT